MFDVGKEKVSHYFEKKNVWLKVFLWKNEINFWQNCWNFFAQNLTNFCSWCGKTCQNLGFWKLFLFHRKLTLTSRMQFWQPWPIFPPKNGKNGWRNKNLKNYSLLFGNKKTFPQRVAPDCSSDNPAGRTWVELQIFVAQ